MVFPKLTAHKKLLLSFPTPLMDQGSDDSDSDVEVIGVRWKAAKAKDPATGSDGVGGDEE
jgi:hypothetical protein